MITWMLALASPAHAYTTTFCGRIANNFSDEELGDQWEASTMPTVPLRGVRVSVTKFNASGVYQGMLLDEQAAGSDGCTTFTTQAGWTYGAWITSSARVNGVDVEVYAEVTGATQYIHVRDFGTSNTRYAPTSSETRYIQPGFASMWATLAVGAHAMYLNNAALNGAGCECSECGALEYSNTSTGTGGGNGSYQTRIIIASSSKFSIAHETGHGVVRRRDGCTTPVDEWDAPGDLLCDATDIDHATIQDGTVATEWQSASLKEGWAEFYSAWMWNTRASPCRLKGENWSQDVDLNGSKEYLSINGPYADLNCEGPPLSGALSYIDGKDWLEDLVDHPNDPSPGERCSISLTGVGTPFDVARYLWDMYTDQQVEFSTLVNIYDNSDPHDWEGRADTNPLGIMSNPYIRWRSAILAWPASAYTNPSLYERHLAEASNGLDHGPGQ
jgi:hypothetical protein